MGTMELVVVGVGLAMDAFAAAVCRGLCMKRFNLSHGLVIALCFGFFQGAMPVVGWFLGVQFEAYITGFDHWLAFILLVFIGAVMIREGAGQDGEACAPAECQDDFSLRRILVLAVATSIDALAVGVTFAFLDVAILPAGSIIALITALLAFLGVWAGFQFGSRWKQKAEIAGGIILILIGLKILLEHTGLIGQTGIL